MNERKRIVVVLGMHRSGTSVVTRALQVMGVDLGSNLMPAMQKVNDKGFWEDVDVVSLNEEILEALSITWHHLFPVTLDEVKKINRLGFLSRAVKLLRKKMRNCQVFGLKDPRMVKLLPFWKQVFARLDVEVNYIITLRHPLSVSRSLFKRDGFPLEKGHLMWLDHIVSSLDETLNEMRILVDYDLLIENPEWVVTRIAQKLNLEIESAQLQEFKNEFLDSGLRHSVFSQHELINSSSVPFTVFDVYSSLLKIKLTESQLETPVFLKKIAGWKKTILSQKQSWILVNHLTTQHNQTRNQLVERDAQLAERDAQLAERDAQLVERDAQLVERNAKLAERDAQLAERDAQLAERDAQLAEIFISKAWRVATILRKIRMWLAPPGSLRAYIGRKILSLPMRLFALRREHRTLGELDLIRGSEYFDKEWYLSQNPDIVSSGVDPARHYLFFGGFEGRDPSLRFSSKQYLSMYPDVRTAEINPLIHYLKFGQKEGRSSLLITNNIPDSQSGYPSDTSLLKIISRVPQKVGWYANFVFNNLSLSRIKNTLTLASKGDFRKIQQHIRELWKLYIGWNENKQKIEELDFCLDILVTPDNQKQKTDITSSVDIIIPVFNGIHLLERLFTSLFKNTRYPFNVIVVDDCSTDPVVRPFLEKIAAQYPNIKLIANQKNQGFVASVNLAARQAQNHFVILNTDVEVPTDWLSRLMLPIFNDDAIASTTPFTNAGTICSFPEQNMDNPLAYGLDLETIDQAFQYINSVKFTHEIPTGVGFCMGINKNVWQDIGEFDEILFGRGYGEENDWCMRASKRGYRNIIVTNLFVYHKHGGSFLSQEKRNLLAKNYAKLIDAHPDYPRLVHQFISDDPLFQTRLVARLMLAKTVASQTCLIFDHDLGGGTTVYRERLLQERVADGQTVFLLTNNPIQKTYKLEVVFQGERLIFTLNDLKTLNRLNQYVTIDEIICNSLVSYEDVPSVLEKIVELKLKNGSILSVCLHDFFLLCPSYTLLNHRGAYCDLPSIDVCDNCLPKNPYKSVKPEIKINLWRQKWSVLLGVTERVICFSKDSADILQRIYSLNDEQIIIRPHTLPHTLRKVKISSSNIRIGVVGGINYQKGYQIVVDTAKILEKSAPDAKIIIIGDVITTPDNKNIIVLGKYKPEELPDIVESYGINLAFFSSIWPETFSYVISELMQMELPICAFNLGAQAERLRAYSMAHLISRVDAGVAANEILEFHAKILGQKKILPD